MNERGCAPIKLEKQAVECRKRSLQPRNSFWHYPSILRHSRVSCQQEIQRGQQATVLPVPPTYQAGPEAERRTELHSRSYSTVKQLSVQVHTQPRTITPSLWHTSPNSTSQSNQLNSNYRFSMAAKHLASSTVTCTLVCVQDRNHSSMRRKKERTERPQAGNWCQHALPTPRPLPSGTHLIFSRLRDLLDDAVISPVLFLLM